MTIPSDKLRDRAARLGLHGVVSRWTEMGALPWVDSLISVEETERHERSQARRIKRSRVGRFKPMTDFDWSWPSSIEREQIEDLFGFGFLEKDTANVIIVGPNGIGKSMIAQNLAHMAILRGHTVLMTTASEMLNDLAAQETTMSFARRIRKYVHPRLLVIDELGYLSYNARHADLLFEVVTRRYQDRSTIVTTNLEFKRWHETFPNASSVVTLVDRLVHKSEIVEIAGESYRCKEALEDATRKAALRKARQASTENRTKKVTRVQRP